MDPIKKRLVHFIVSRPLLSLFLPPLITIIFLIGLKNFESQFSPRVWFDSDHPEIIRLNQFEQRFGGEQFVTLGIYAKKGKVTEEDLKYFTKITEELWQLPDVVRVETITNFNDIRGEGDEIIVEPLSDTFSSAEQFKKKVEDLELIHNVFTNEEVDYFIFNSYLKPYFKENPDFSTVVDATRTYINKVKKNDFDIFLLGPASVTNAFRKVTGADIKLMMPLMFFFTILLLWYQFRNIMSVVVPILLILMTIGSSLGTMSWQGFKYNGMMGALPGILMAICLADSIHIFITFFQFQNMGRNVQDSIKDSLEKNFLPTILTTVTTAISFFTISLTELAPVHALGLIAAFGAFLAWWYTYFLIPGFILNFPKMFESSFRQETSGFISGAVYIRWIKKYMNVIIFVFISLFVVGSWLSLQVEVNSDPVKYFADSMPLKRAYDFSKEKLKGLKGINVVIDSGENEGIKDPAFLRKVDEFKKWLKTDSEIIQVRSIVDTIKKLNSVLHPDLKEQEIPHSRKAVAEQLFLYQISLPQGAGTENFVSLDNRYIRMNVSWSIESSKEGIIKSESIIKHATEELDLKASVEGNFPIYTKVNQIVVFSFMKSMFLTIFIVGIILFVVFRKVLISLLSMLPNILPLVVGTTVMACAGIFLDIATSIVAAICLGIAVDDTIHFVSGYLNHRKSGLNSEEALQKTYEGTGKALILTTVILVVGFGVFIFADFLPNRYFGMLCAIVLSYALLTDLLLLPALLLKWDKSM